MSNAHHPLGQRAVRSARIGGFLMASVVLASCEVNPVGPGAAENRPSGLRFIADPVVTMTQGETLTMRLEALGPGGRFTEQPAANYSWSSSNTSVIEVSAGVLRATNSGYGQAAITARSSDGQTAETLAWVQLPAHLPSTYRITLQFGENVPALWRDGFVTAAKRWQRVIRTSLPPAAIYDTGACPPYEGRPSPRPPTGIETGTHVIVEVADHLPGAGATGTPCLQRPLPNATAIYGRILINRNTLQYESRAYSTPLHELGHVLGLVGLVRGSQPSWIDPRTGWYSGPFGIEGYRRLFGTAPPSLFRDGAHWDSVPDIMSSRNGAPRVTALTVGALMDLGYPAAWYGAE